jgi:hypothetical protein
MGWGKNGIMCVILTYRDQFTINHGNFSSLVWIQSSMTIFDPRPFLDSCQINSGPYKGAYRVAPGGMLHWYFANIGLLPFVKAMPEAVRTHLDLYLAHLETDGTIRDVLNPDGPEPKKQLADSDDAYAATFLTLAVAYIRTHDDPSWVHANQESLKNIALKNIVASQKPGGLIRVFQDTSRSSAAYLQDNCEAYRGLLDIAPYLPNEAERQCRTSAAMILDGLIKLYDGRVGAYKAADTGEKMMKRFYPDATGQAFPIVFGLPQTPDKKLRSWYWLNKQMPRWHEGAHDQFPWMILGYTAALMGDKERATAQMRYVRELAHKKRHLVTINELGYAERLRQLGL